MQVAGKLPALYQGTIQNGQYQIAGHWIQPMTQTKYDWNKIKNNLCNIWNNF